MHSFTLTHKDLLELKFWLTCDIEQERAENLRCRSLFGLAASTIDPTSSVLEIGTGPIWGLLPHIYAHRRVAVDPLIEVFKATGILEEGERGSIQYYSEAFERWDTNEKFDTIFCINALDHGEMGFHLVPKLSALLNPGGRLFIYVHLRPPELLNLIHDHSLSEDQLDRNLKFTDLKEIKRGFEIESVLQCRALFGVWRKP
jgi:protein-L-isoaspartate O-methyltransferase